MSTGAYNESAYEKAVLDLLAGEGWTVEYGPDIGRDYSDPTWDEVLRERVFAINRDTPNEAINEALAKVKDIAGGSVVARNAAFTDCLQNGVEATCVLFGEERTVLVDLVDWDRRDSARAHMRMLVKRLLKKYKYPPDEAKGALETVMRQCELWVDETEFKAVLRA